MLHRVNLTDFHGSLKDTEGLLRRICDAMG